jgi:hypothetical protein
MKRREVLSALAFTLTGTAPALRAQPSTPIRILVGASAGAPPRLRAGDRAWTPAGRTVIVGTPVRAATSLPMPSSAPDGAHAETTSHAINATLSRC